MNWLTWIVVAVLVVAAVIWLVRRFRTEGRRIDDIIRDFDRENPRREPGAPASGRRLAAILRRR